VEAAAVGVAQAKVREADRIQSTEHLKRKLSCKATPPVTDLLVARNGRTRASSGVYFALIVVIQMKPYPES
jgi:hypothetical protein